MNAGDAFELFKNFGLSLQDKEALVLQRSATQSTPLKQHCSNVGLDASPANKCGRFVMIVLCASAVMCPTCQLSMACVQRSMEEVHPDEI